MTSNTNTRRALVVAAETAALAARLGLEADLVAPTATSPEAVRAAIADTEPDLIVVDLALPDDPFEVLAQVQRTRPAIGVVAVTSRAPDRATVARALASGAHAIVHPNLSRSDLDEAFDRAAHQEAWLPCEQVAKMLAEEIGSETTTLRRQARFGGLAIALIPFAGALTALVSLLHRRYLGQIGVRPVDLAIDPASRLADLFFTVSNLAGIVGPLLFVGSWINLCQQHRDRRGLRFLAQHPGWARLLLTVGVLAATSSLAALNQLLFVLFVGPAVIVLLVLKVLDLDDDLPQLLRITRLPARQATYLAITTFVLLLSVLSYEVIVRGPQFGPQGEEGWIAADFLGISAQPVRATRSEDGAVSEMLFLGANTGLYVLVDPCDDDRVDLLSVGTTTLSVIDRVNCAD